MITKVKAYFIIATITLCSCSDSNHSEVNENANLNELDSIIANQTLAELSADENPILDSLKIEVDGNCEAHFAIAINQKIPADIEIVHCNYWSTDHPIWLEHSYSFEIEKNDPFFLELIDYNQMVTIKDESAVISESNDWFLPKPFSNYEGFYTEDDFDDFQIFRDLESGAIFIRGSQY
jgi:hypothetical protein